MYFLLNSCISSIVEAATIIRSQAKKFFPVGIGTFINKPANLLMNLKILQIE